MPFLNFIAGLKNVSVMTDIDGSRVLEVAPERTIEACDSLWKTLSEAQKDHIQAVCMDMWQAYETSTEKLRVESQELRGKVSLSLDSRLWAKVRRAEHKQLQSDGYDRLKGVRHTVLFNPENLSKEKDEQLTVLLKSTLKTARAWNLKESFRFF